MFNTDTKNIYSKYITEKTLHVRRGVDDMRITVKDLLEKTGHPNFILKNVGQDGNYAEFVYQGEIQFSRKGEEHPQNYGISRLPQNIKPGTHALTIVGKVKSLPGIAGSKMRTLSLLDDLDMFETINMYLDGIVDYLMYKK